MDEIADITDTISFTLQDNLDKISDDCIYVKMSTNPLKCEVLMVFLLDKRSRRPLVQCSFQFCVKLVDIAGRKIRIRKIGIINLMVISVIFSSCLYTNTCNYMSYNKEKYRKTNIIIIHKKINLNDHFTVPGLAEMEIGLGRKIGISQNWNPQNWREHCIPKLKIK